MQLSDKLFAWGEKNRSSVAHGNEASLKRIYDHGADLIVEAHDILRTAKKLRK